MNNDFYYIVKQLFQRFSLDEPDAIENIISLQIDEQEIHITEYPENNLLMFCHIDHAKINGQSVLFQRNMFTDNILTPILSQEKVSQDWILWNRQPLNNSTSESLYQQLELLYDSGDYVLCNKITEKNYISENIIHLFKR